MRKAGGEAIFVKCDVSQEDQVKAMVQATLDTYGKIDILVNNAGIGVYKSVLDTTSEDWDRCLDVNLKGQFLCCQICHPAHAEAQGKGTIVNISSVHSFQTVNGVAPYAASKGGITALTRNMAIDYGPAIRVNSIAPGWVLTPLIQSIFDSYDDPADQQRQVERPPGDEAHRHAGGYRLRSGFPGQRRGFLHHRHAAVRGRRPDRPARDGGEAAGRGLWQMMQLQFNITKDDLSAFAGKGPAFVTFGETMVRDTPCDMQRLESTRQVYISLAGSELTLCDGAGSLRHPVCLHHPRPRQSLRLAGARHRPQPGHQHRLLRLGAKAEPIGRFLYELGRTPRKSVGYYQRMYSAASQLGPGMVDWKTALRDCRLFHTSGITFGLSTHSKYERNYLLEAFQEAVANKPAGCLVGMDFNYRATLWTPEQCRAAMTPLLQAARRYLDHHHRGYGCPVRDRLRAVFRRADRQGRYRRADRRRYPGFCQRRSPSSSTPRSWPSPSATRIPSSSSAGRRPWWTPRAISSARRR